jgi:hypothetical protein
MKLSPFLGRIIMIDHLFQIKRKSKPALAGDRRTVPSEQVMPEFNAFELTNQPTPDFSRSNPHAVSAIADRAL